MRAQQLRGHGRSGRARAASWRGKLARTNPAARLLVTGCYATLEGETTAQLPNVSLVVGNTRKDELLRIIDEFTANRQ